MTVGAGISVSNGSLNVLGETIFTDVHHNITVTPATGGSLINGAFIGVRSDRNGSRRVFPVGKLRFVSSLSIDFLSTSSVEGPCLLNENC